jgi:hypothetical protein
MRTFPLDGCPTASALLAYIEGHVGPDLRACVEAHARECQACTDALAGLREAMAAPVDTTREVMDRGSGAHSAASENSAVLSGEPATEDTRDDGADVHSKLLESIRDGFTSYVARYRADSARPIHERLADQRAVIGRMLNARRPPLAFGQVWTVTPPPPRPLRAARAAAPGGARRQCNWSDPEGAAFSFLILVVSHHTSAADNTALANVVPVTEDDRLATEWSLILDAQHSGIGGPAVIHVDLERSASIECLRRYVGSLPDKAGEDLLCVAHAWSRSDAPPCSLSVGRLGQAAVRTRPDWQSFDDWLSISMEEICASQTTQDLADDATCDIAPNVIEGGPIEATGSDSSIASVATTGPTGNDAPPPRPTTSLPQHHPSTRALGPSRDVANPGTSVGRVGAVGSITPASGKEDGFLEAVRQLLAANHGGSLTVWAEKNSCTLEWDDLLPWRAFALDDLISRSDWRPVFVSLGTGLVVPGRQQAVLRLANEVRYHVTQQGDFLRGQSVSQRAARRQSPPRRKDPPPSDPLSDPSSQ